MTERTFDRRVRFDPLSRNFPITAVVGSGSLFITKVWECNTWNDQGVEGACVGFGWGHELAATPEPVPADTALSRSIYRRAQQLDIWAGENYEGTSVLGGAKAVKEVLNNVGEPYIKEYRWAFGITDLMRALAYQGPVVLGLNWYTGMFDTNSAGWLSVSGSLAGGHCLLAIGVVIVPLLSRPVGVNLDDVDLDKSYILLHNSWGKSWGMNGQAKVSIRNMQRLLAEDGDACVPMVRVSDYVAPPVEPEVPVVDEPVEPEADPYFATRRSKVYHDIHKGLTSFRTFDSEETAVAAGFRPCKTCKP